MNLIYLHGEMISLVLDDYHAIEPLEIHKGMSDFLFYLPGNCRLILATREDPPFPLSELRARNKLVELRFEVSELDAGDFIFNYLK